MLNTWRDSSPILGGHYQPSNPYLASDIILNSPFWRWKTIAIMRFNVRFGRGVCLNASMRICVYWGNYTIVDRQSRFTRLVPPSTHDS